MEKITVVIPTYEMQGIGTPMLKRALDSVMAQTFENYNVIVCDTSENDEIYRLVKKYKNVQYVFSFQKGMAPNTNEAMKNASGELVKILYQDDFLADNNALQDIVDNFIGEWLITPANNNINPYWTDDIESGNNHLGSPSALTVRKETMMFFDEKLTWLLDCDLYKRYYTRHGPPVITKNVGVIIGIGDHQMTNIIPDERKQSEFIYLNQKYHG